MAKHCTVPLCASPVCALAMDFAALGLDARVVRAAARKFQLPTAVQAQAIPLALAGQARAAAGVSCPVRCAERVRHRT